jgi:hypothetical protein
MSACLDSGQEFSDCIVGIKRCQEPFSDFISQPMCFRERKKRFLTRMALILRYSVKKPQLATESTEEHGNINALKTVFSCSSVDSVAIISVFIRLNP